MSEKSQAQRAAEVVERSQRALVRGDAEGYVECFTKDATLFDPALPPMKGHEEIRKGVHTLHQMIKQPEILELTLLPVGRSVAFKVKLRFVTPKGQQITMDSIDVFELNEDFKIYQGRSWYDIEGLQKLL
jgi:glutathione S-transferase